METRVRELSKHAVPEHGSAESEDEIAVAALGGMQNNAKPVKVVGGIIAKVSWNIGNWEPTLERLAI